VSDDLVTENKDLFIADCHTGAPSQPSCTGPIAGSLCKLGRIADGAVELLHRRRDPAVPEKRGFSLEVMSHSLVAQANASFDAYSPNYLTAICMPSSYIF